MSLVLERRASKDEILELYLNDVYLGQRGSFAIHGVAEAARLFFGKDVANLSLQRGGADRRRHSESRPAIAVRQSRARGRTPQRRAAGDGRRGVHLAGRGRARHHASRCRWWRAPSTTRRPTSSTWSASRSRRRFPASPRRPDASTSSRRSTSTCSARRSTRCATGWPTSTSCSRAGGGRSRRRRRSSPSIRAPARFSRWSAAARTTSRSTTARSPRGASRDRCSSRSSILAAFERAAEEGRTDLTPASLTVDEPSTFSFDDQVWEPRNYDDYDGEITWRRALAMSRNLGTIHVGEAVGFDRVAALWRRVGVGTPPRRLPRDHARRVRADAARSRAGLHAVRQRRARPSAHVDPAHRDRREGASPEGADAQARRARRHDVPRHQHDAQRAQRGHRRGRARRGVRARRRRQDRHDQRPARRVVRRLHAGAAHRGLGRLRQQSAGVADAARRRRCRSGRRS